MESPLLVPPPKELGIHGGRFAISSEGYVALHGGNPGELLISAEKLRCLLPGGWVVTASPRAVGRAGSILLRCDPAVGGQGPEFYTLEITSDGVTVTGATPAAIYRGACKLAQLIAADPKSLPTLSIRDWPDFPVRGAMIDVSRCKVPTMETLYSFVDLLSEWGINHLELYTEHTFAYVGHENVWCGASPMTGGDILELDRYCAERFIELTPNQNSFSHMERWLKHPEYVHLADSPEGCEFPWGFARPTVICPGLSESVDFLSDLYSQLLPHFTSKLFNVGCDEAYGLELGRSKEMCEKLGKGRVYLDFLLKVYDLVASGGRTMMFWGDIMLHHPELIPELPKDMVALDWGYEAGHPFDSQTREYGKSGVPFWVCPGTSAWNSIAGRTNNCIGNLRNAAANGAANGATGFLNTDWGDGGHPHYLPVSYLGFLYGASMSWNAKADIADRLPQALDTFAFRDSAGVMGQAAFDLGNTYECLAVQYQNSTPIWRQLITPISNLEVAKEITEAEFASARSVAEEVIGRVDGARMDRPDGELIRDEYANAARMTMLACDLGVLRLKIASGSSADELERNCRKALTEIVEEHKRLWLARNRPGGLDESIRSVQRAFADASPC